MIKTIMSCIFSLLCLTQTFTIKAATDYSNFSVLIMGNDGGGTRDPLDVRADSLILTLVNPSTGEIKMISIPRDSYVDMPCKRNPDKINHAYAFGKEDCTIRTVSDLFQLPVDFYITINFDSFIQLFDIIGPVPLTASHTFCEQDLYNSQYCFSEGEVYQMDGAMALSYARHRKTDSDFNRTQRQQEVIEAAIKQLKQPQSMTKLSQLFKLYNETVSTNIPYSFAFTLLPMLFKDITLSRTTLVGTDSWEDYYYFLLDKNELARLNRELRSFYYSY